MVEDDQWSKMMKVKDDMLKLHLNKQSVFRFQEDRQHAIELIVSSLRFGCFSLVTVGMVDANDHCQSLTVSGNCTLCIPVRRQNIFLELIIVNQQEQMQHRHFGVDHWCIQLFPVTWATATYGRHQYQCLVRFLRLDLLLFLFGIDHVKASQVISKFDEYILAKSTSSSEELRCSAADSLIRSRRFFSLQSGPAAGQVQVTRLRTRLVLLLPRNHSMRGR